MLFDPPLDYWTVKLKAGSRFVPATISKEQDRLFIAFGYNPSLLEEVKSFEGSKWHGYDEEPRKSWSVKDSPHNRFQLRYLAYPNPTDPNNPYFHYEQPIAPFVPYRKLYSHQIDLSAFAFARRQGILAAEPGVGKTLTMIEVIEKALMLDWIWVAPKSALISVQLEFAKWKSMIQPSFYTYEGLLKLIQNWPSGKKAPFGVVFDEASRLKNPTAKRTLAAQHLGDAIRSEWGLKGFVILMSGTPAPKSPADWFSLCRIACPGYLREGTFEKFKNRLAIIEQRETFAGGGMYPHLKTWKDDEKKCNICGLEQEAETHSSGVNVFGNDPLCHAFVPSANEVAKLYTRMKGLVEVKLKATCLELPSKIYREIICKPSRSILNAASAIQARAVNTVTALVLSRELSDGFQYIQTVEGSEICPVCLGMRTSFQDVPPDDVGIEDLERGSYEDGTPIAFTKAEAACTGCSGAGFIDKLRRETKQVECPKEEVLKDLLEEYEDIGRVVIYGGFKGTIDRICSIVKSQKWNFIRIDGRGWVTDLPCTKAESMVNLFQTGQEQHPRVAIVGHPGSAGMGLTLTASPVAIYYSNDFNGESRAQSEDRIYRISMDTLRGATMIDILHLPTDKLILDNLKKKKKLQSMTMGEFQAEVAKINLERQT